MIFVRMMRLINIFWQRLAKSAHILLTQLWAIKLLEIGRRKAMYIHMHKLKEEM